MRFGSGGIVQSGGAVQVGFWVQQVWQRRVPDSFFLIWLEENVHVAPHWKQRVCLVVGGIALAKTRRELLPRFARSGSTEK